VLSTAFIFLRDVFSTSYLAIDQDQASKVQPQSYGQYLFQSQQLLRERDQRAIGDRLRT
jgi:hypothetical protein